MHTILRYSSTPLHVLNEELKEAYMAFVWQTMAPVRPKVVHLWRESAAWMNVVRWTACQSFS